MCVESMYLGCFRIDVLQSQWWCLDRFPIRPQVQVRFVIFFLIEQFSPWIDSSVAEFPYFLRSNTLFVFIHRPLSRCLSRSLNEMIFAREWLRRWFLPGRVPWDPLHRTPFGLLGPHPSPSCEIAGCVTRTSLSPRSARGDLVHSASHNFIRPDHGSPGTLWQMYPSANFKLVPAV